MKMRLVCLLCSLLLFTCTNADQPPKVKVGIDQLFQSNVVQILKGKRVGLITNHTAVNEDLIPTVDVIRENAKSAGYTLVALFAPEHGIDGSAYAYESVDHLTEPGAVPIYSLHGETQRPTDEMLKNIDLLLFDIQDIGSRSYTYISTMFFAIEEAAKHHIAFVVLDRPNPINGLTIDGPMLDPEWRSAIGYINVPYCHGMTVGELAKFFNEEYKVGCNLSVIPMKGWKRSMDFNDTGLQWIPTSPYIPDVSTPYFYPTTGILGELGFVSIGIGYTLPFKVVGAPWIDAVDFAKRLNAQKFPGVYFKPFYFRPVYGRFAKEDCEGVLILITDKQAFKPMSTQYLLLGMLKGLYPEKFEEAITTAKKKRETMCKLNGTEEIYRLIVEERNIVWKLRGMEEKGREEFMRKRARSLIVDYVN